MTAQQLQELFLSQQPYLELVRLLESRGTVIGLDSLVGSSYALVAALTRSTIIGKKGRCKWT